MGLHRPANAVFITGTDTGAGKTVITGLLYRYLLKKKINAVTQKWIQSGAGRYGGDVARHLRLAGRGKDEFLAHDSSAVPYRFTFPASPHLASRLEGREISSPAIKRSFRTLADRFECVLVEGIGGALVPFTKKRLVIDIARELRLPVVIAALNKLGAINHTLLTIEAIRKRGMRILGIIFNNSSRGDNPLILKDNPKIVRSVSNECILGNLPWSKDTDRLYECFIPIGDKLLRRLRRK